MERGLPEGWILYKSDLLGCRKVLQLHLTLSIARLFW
jgi:hypothetical protein